jgi:hypothetical protein
VTAGPRYPAVVADRRLTSRCSGMAAPGLAAADRRPASRQAGLIAGVLAAALAAACSDPPAGSTDASVADARPGPADAAPDAPPDAYDGPPLPDLTINLQRAIVDLALEQRTFAEDACELDPSEDCIGGPGLRTLLRFGVETPNIGTDDLVLGTPSAGNDNFVYSPCHEHFHFEGYAVYSLVDAQDNEVAAGQKQAFCLLDTDKYLTDDPTVGDDVKYFCGYQGIQRGWSDVYHSRLPCQFIDVTDAPAGSYTLRVEINSARTLPEIRYDNNLIEIPIDLDAADLYTPTEPCPAGFDHHATDGLHRECGWDHATDVVCQPGTMVDIGCAAECGLGTCTGDPILRVCDADRPDGNCSYPGTLDDDDDSCGSQCPRVRNVPCPGSGTLAVYTAPFRVGEPYTCEIEVQMQ